MTERLLPMQKTFIIYVGVTVSASNILVADGFEAGVFH